MSEKYRQSSLGAWHSVKKFLDTPKNGRPNASPLISDVTSTTFQTSFESLSGSTGQNDRAFDSTASIFLKECRGELDLGRSLR